ncbi:BCAS2 family [Fusarium beomiforme]|uniref:BCAS2 family n=1 Tax=Fusarium beomiforme TaxID=44412 RepID=A0A9P5AQ61_9HYPO|nr:BCAS2 family [Fusarium beomiforme]
MPVPPAYHESLPYVDQEPNPEALAAARALVAVEASSQPPLPTSNPEPSFTPAMTAELDRLSKSTPLAPLDLGRYEAPSPSAPPASALPAAAIAHSYLSSRLTNLELLEKWGKNAWLLGNHALETELQALERELAAAKREIDIVNLERQKRQNAVGAEIKTLDDTWRSGVGRVLETEIAVEELRRMLRDELARRVADGQGQ